MTATVDRAELWRLRALEMPEKELQASVELELKAAHWLAYHVYDSRRSVAGFPDLHALRGTRQLVIELKSQRGRMGVAQDIWRKAYEKVGAEYFLWRPIHLLDGTIAKVLA